MQHEYRYVILQMLSKPQSLTSPQHSHASLQATLVCLVLADELVLPLLISVDDQQLLQKNDAISVDGDTGLLQLTDVVWTCC